MIVSTRRRLAARRPGFTLLEVLVVVAILVILAGVAGVYVFGFLDQAKDDIARDQCGKIERAVDAFMLKSQAQGMEPTLTMLWQGVPERGIQPVLDGPTSVQSPWHPTAQFQFQMAPEPGSGRLIPQVMIQSPNGVTIMSKKWQALQQQ